MNKLVLLLGRICESNFLLLHLLDHSFINAHLSFVGRKLYSHASKCTHAKCCGYHPTVTTAKVHKYPSFRAQASQNAGSTCGIYRTIETFYVACYAICNFLYDFRDTEEDSPGRRVRHRPRWTSLSVGNPLALFGASSSAQPPLF
jgi:hypothetical protein